MHTIPPNIHYALIYLRYTYITHLRYTLHLPSTETTSKLEQLKEQVEKRSNRMSRNSVCPQAIPTLSIGWPFQNLDRSSPPAVAIRTKDGRHVVSVGIGHTRIWFWNYIPQRITQCQCRCTFWLYINKWHAHCALLPWLCHITPLMSFVKLKKQMKSPQISYKPAPSPSQDWKARMEQTSLAVLSPAVDTAQDCRGCTSPALYSRSFLGFSVVPILPTSQPSSWIPRLQSWCPQCWSSRHRNKTLHRILQEAYWVGMSKDVNRHCQACKKCQQSKLPSPQHALLVNIPMGRPWQMIAADVPEVPISSKNNLLVVGTRLFYKVGRSHSLIWSKSSHNHKWAHQGVLQTWHTTLIKDVILKALFWLKPWMHLALLSPVQLPTIPNVMGWYDSTEHFYSSFVHMLILKRTGGNTCLLFCMLIVHLSIFQKEFLHSWWRMEGNPSSETYHTQQLLMCNHTPSLSTGQACQSPGLCWVQFGCFSRSTKIFLWCTLFSLNF